MSAHFNKFRPANQAGEAGWASRRERTPETPGVVADAIREKRTQSTRPAISESQGRDNPRLEILAPRDIIASRRRR